MEQGYKPQSYKAKAIDPADVEVLRKYLLANNLKTATQRDLIAHLALECFENKHSKSYIKKLVYALSNKLFEQ